MGLAASQGRYLCLTARMSDLVYEGQQISQQRMALAKESAQIADEYNEAMSNRIMQANIIGEDGSVQSQQLTYGIITSKDPFSGLGMRIVDIDGNVVVPKKEYSLEVSSVNESGETVTNNFATPADFIAEYLPNLTPEESDNMSSWTFAELKKYYEEKNPETNLTLTVKDNIDETLKNENERYVFDEKCTDPKYLQEMLSSGQWLLQQQKPSSEEGWDDVVWQGSSRVSDVLDTSDDAAAEAKYEAAMKELQKKDKILELRLEQVQTEEQSVETEIDSIKQVISKNIEDSFGTFA